MWDLRGWFSYGIRKRNSQSSENIFPKQYASHDDKEFQIEHWYTQPEFHKRTAINQYFLARHVNYRCIWYGPDSNLMKGLGEGDEKSWGQNLAPSGAICRTKLRNRQRDLFAAQTFRRALRQLWHRIIQIWRRHPGVGYYVSGINPWIVYGCQFQNSWNIWLNYAIIYYSSADPGFLKTPSVPFTGYLYAQLKCIVAMLIAGCLRIGRKWHLRATIDIES